LPFCQPNEHQFGCFQGDEPAMIAGQFHRHVASALFLIAFLLAQAGLLTVSAQLQESSPIEIDLVAPQQAGPGEIIDILIQYDITDPNAGAMLNFNLTGPAHIRTRIPEPPNPIVNTWGPQFNPAQGTIKVQVQIDDGTDGQKLQYMVEVKWGTKYVKFHAETQIKYVPSTPTPVPTARPRSQPTQPAPTPVDPTLDLTTGTLIGQDDKVVPLTAAEANQVIGLDVAYTSSGPLEDVTLVVRFEPDVVNLEGLERTGSGYIVVLSDLPAAPDGASIPGAPFWGRVRPFPDGEQMYELKAIVEIQLPEGAASNVPGAIETESVTVSQRSVLTVRVSVDGDTVKAGGSVIVHAICDNLGQVTMRGVRLHLKGLPDGFAAQPAAQVIDSIPADGGSRERLFTIRTPEGREERATFTIVATLEEGETVVESAPVSIEVAAPVPLAVDVSADRSAVRAGGVVYFSATIQNAGQFAAPDVTARLIDTTGNLGVLLQSVGDIAPGETHDLVFVVEIPADFPVDVLSSVILQTVSADGSTSESAPLSLTVACVPSFELSVQTPAGKLEGGQSAEAVVVVRNSSQCTARDVSLRVVGLPDSFGAAPAQRIVELGPGETRHITFNLLIPEGHPQGNMSFAVTVTDSLGTETRSGPAALAIGGVSMLFTVVFGLLAIVAVAAVVFGLASFFRQR
jgi:hypothetical protein